MDESMQALIETADLKTKWRVTRRTMARRKPVNGMQLGYANPGLVFFSNWLKDGWINVSPNRWVIASACTPVYEPPCPPPVTYGNLVQLLPDYELPERFRKARNHVPQTVRLLHYGNGNIPYTNDLFKFMLDLNPGLTVGQFENVSDSWNRKGEKFRDGERKYPYELSFALNTHMIKRRFLWAGGLNVPAGVMMLELDTLHPEFLPPPETIAKSPYAIYLNTVANGRTNKYPGGATPCVALVSPVPLFIEEERTRPVTTLQHPYDV